MNLEREFTRWKGFKNSETKNFRKLSEAVSSLQYWFDELNNALEEANKENQYLKEENYKDSELADMKAKLEEAKADAERYRKDMYRGFSITKEEQDKIEEWEKNHDTLIHANPKQYHGVSGGGYTYEFYPTAIGTIGTCICNICRRNAYDSAYANGSFNSEEYKRYMDEHDGEFEFQSI